VGPYLKYSPGIFCEGTGVKTTKNLSRCPGQNSNQESPNTSHLRYRLNQPVQSRLHISNKRPDVKRFGSTMNPTEIPSRDRSTRAWYSAGPAFKSRPAHPLPWLGVFVAWLNPFN
jgi:hypothetical protein